MDAVKLDEKILQEIHHELRCVPGVEPGDVKVAVESGVVTLTGQVANHSIRQAVEQLARHMHGVRSVVDDIRIHRSSSIAEHEANLVRAVVEAFGRGHKGPN
jgi:osmotically-inducible protein OsmY